jgi:hypothetical protein
MDMAHFGTWKSFEEWRRAQAEAVLLVEILVNLWKIMNLMQNEVV